jgi:cytochrome c-type biogenesis protein CcmE
VTGIGYFVRLFPLTRRRGGAAALQRGREMAAANLFTERAHGEAFGYTMASEGGMRKYGKFAVLIAIVIGALVWLASSGVSETKTYYKTISEVAQMGDQAYQERLRVAGDVASGSIQHAKGEVQFTLTQDKQQLKVAYTGSDPLPDTFRDGAQALADGRMGRDGVFHASKIQAKCASKYEAKPGQLRGAPAPPVNKSI